MWYLSLGSTTLLSCRYRPTPTRPSAYLPAYPGSGGSGMQFVCPAHLEVAPDREYRLFIGDQTVRDCGAPCRKMFFTDAQLGKKPHREKRPSGSRIRIRIQAFP